jgi:flagellar biosynthetic protein FliR
VQVPTQWIPYVVPALLIACRLSGLLITAPFLGEKAVPPRIKAALVVALTAVLLPVTAAPANRSALAWMGEGLSELMIGVLLGLAAQLVFEGVQLAGTVASFQLGLGLETAIDPTTQADSTVVATFHRLIVVYIFLQMGVHRWILLALVSSFTTLPLGVSLNVLSARQLLDFAGNLWIWGLELVLPILIATLVIDVTVAFFAKAAPQLPVIFVGIPVKALVGYLVLIAAIRYWPGLLHTQFQSAVTFFLHNARPL